MTFLKQCTHQTLASSQMIVSSTSTSPVSLQDDLTTLEHWETTWQMQFHPEKCTLKRSTNPMLKRETSYSLHGHTLVTKDSSKYVGVTISQDLSWKPHIDATVGKGQRTLGFIRRILRECSIEVKKTAYTTLARLSKYASSVWDPHTAIDSQCTEQVQRKATRFACITIQTYHQDSYPVCCMTFAGSPGGQKTPPPT